MKSDFLSIASHELRTPLTSMQGSIKTLRRSDITLTSDEALQLLAVLDRQSDRLTRLVEDLLLVSRIDAGGVSLRFESVDVGEVCNDLLRELGRRGERVSVALPPDLPHILTDGQRVYQVARNLVENALKFSPEESIVRVTVHGDGDRLLLEVEDSGPGIHEAELPSIFDRFHQIGGALRRRADGFGLGLYITKRLVEALRGEIEVSSVVGKGTTFRVRIPFQRAETAATETA
jgi:two-component system sensor histidine kinase VicK